MKLHVISKTSTRSLALQEEHRIRTLSRASKLELIDSLWPPELYGYNDKGE